jgi:uncharacterized protein YyaL (SSP411 family)
MAKNLFKLGTYLYREDFLETARKMLLFVDDDVHQNPYYYSNWAIQLANFAQPPYEVVVIGDDYEADRLAFSQQYLPDVILSGGPEEGDLKLHTGKFIERETMIYVCRNRICKLPVREISEAMEQIGN